MPYIATLLLLPLPLLIMRLGFYRGLPIVVFLATGFYYSILGYIYWWNVEGSYFAGVYWGSSLENSSELFSLAVLITSVAYFLGVRKLPSSPAIFISDSLNYRLVSSLKTFRVFSLIGIISCIFVFFDKDSRGPFFLIAYQFSDVAIAVIIFSLTLAPSNQRYRIFALAFVAYCIFVGFRYKLILLAFPLLVLMLINSRPIKRVAILTLFPPAMLVLFSVITVTRVKFSGLDASQLSNISQERLIYGFFADTNILFGVSAITSYVIPGERLVYFQPIIDSFLELLPRFIYQDRETGQQIFYVLEGLVSEEGMSSATTYPFFGEYMNMFGYTGYWVGCTMLGFLIAFLIKKVRSRKFPAITWTSAALISILFGYYYVSRGYLPQFSKSLIFMLLPYFLMVRELNRKQVSPNQSARSSR